jgi:tRNA C32,U32 (ribose-2'-O)-methylase TrmJ
MNTTESIFYRTASEMRTDRINDGIKTVRSLDKALRELRRIPATTAATRSAMRQAEGSLTAAYNNALTRLALQA